MNNILEQIVCQKKSDLISLKKKHSLEFLQSHISPSTASFYSAFKKDKTHFILECKQASPSKGIINTNFNPTLIAQTYNHYATAISVLTDTPYFKGSFDDLKKVRQASHLPLLCKDFFIDPYQIYLARYYGADAILLILSILNDQQYIHLKDIAESLSMGVLTEVSNIAEAQRAKTLRAPMVGINNRNLKDFSTNINKTAQLAPLLSDDQLIISESGISTNSQVRKISPIANGFLIGGSLMQENDLDLACRKLIYGEHKVCGVRDLETIKTLEECGAYYIGFNFVHGSPRYLSVEQAKELSAKTTLPIVGIFCNQPLAAIQNIVDSLSLNSVQLHGDETLEYIQALQNLLPKEVGIWKAVTSKEAPHYQQPYIKRLVLDSKIAGQFGGTGEVFNWDELTGLKKEKILLAGGIGEKNAAAAIAVGCIGLDLNSQLESSPGNKSKEKILKTFAIIRNY